MAAKLASVASLLARLGLEEDDLSDEYLARMGLALSSATLHLEAQLRTSFVREADVTERFSVDPDEFPYVDQYPYLYLRKGIVDLTQPFTVTQSEWYDELVSGGNISTLTIETDYIVDADKGLVMITGDALLNVPGYRKIINPKGPFYAQVVYTAGLTEVSDTYGTTYENVPDWLQEAALMVGMHLYKRSGDCSAPIEDVRKDLGALWALVEQRVRYFPYALKSML